MKCSLTLRAEDGSESEWAFCDPRRLGRIKLVDCEEGDVEKVKPLSDLGVFLLNFTSALPLTCDDEEACRM